MCDAFLLLNLTECLFTLTGTYHLCKPDLTSLRVSTGCDWEQTLLETYHLAGHFADAQFSDRKMPY